MKLTLAQIYVCAEGEQFILYVSDIELNLESFSPSIPTTKS